MIMKKSLIFIALAAFILAGCTTKRQYFKPAEEQIAPQKLATASLPDDIHYATRSGATLDNGGLVTRAGLAQGVKLDKNTMFLGDFDGKYLVSNLNGDFKITQNGDTLWEHKFPCAIVAATLEDNYLAAVDSSNKIHLIDLASDTTIIEYASGTPYGMDARTAAPVFLSSIIVYPTLDGKVMIVDKNQGRILRDAVVSSESFFNNVVFLDVKGDKLFAATLSKLIMISPDKTEYYDGDIKDITLVGDRVYILLKDGNIEITDLNLKSLRKKEFKYAIFSNIIPKGDKLYIFEKTGYAIVTDLDLNNETIIKLDDEIDSKTFAGQNALYYGNKIIKID